MLHNGKYQKISIVGIVLLTLKLVLTKFLGSLSSNVVVTTWIRLEMSQKLPQALDQLTNECRT